jgi:hypothetical protein
MVFGPLCAGCLPRSHTLWTLAGYWLRRLNPTMTQTFLFRQDLHTYVHCRGGYREYVRRSHYLFTDLQAPILLRPLRRPDPTFTNQGNR